MDIPPPTPTEMARWEAQTAIRHVAGKLADGRDIGIQRSVPGLSSTFYDVAPEWGLRAALFVRDFTSTAIRDYAGAARGEGVTWDTLGDLIGLGDEAKEHQLSPGEAAFTFVTEGRRPGQPPSDRSLQVALHFPPALRWSCSTCHQGITDSGPYESDPDSRETGHAPSCTRHAQARTEFRRLCDDLDRDDPEPNPLRPLPTFGPGGESAEQGQGPVR